MIRSQTVFEIWTKSNTFDTFYDMQYIWWPNIPTQNPIADTNPLHTTSTSDPNAMPSLSCQDDDDHFRLQNGPISITSCDWASEKTNIFFSDPNDETIQVMKRLSSQVMKRLLIHIMKRLMMKRVLSHLHDLEMTVYYIIFIIHV